MTLLQRGAATILQRLRFTVRSYGQIDEKVEAGEESEAGQEIVSQVASGK